MRKLKMKVDELNVESFSISNSFGQGGTVRGRAPDPDVPEYLPSEVCGPGGGLTLGTCIGPTYCCATGPTNHVCIGPTYCCNPTANTTCCAPATDTCPGTAYFNTCNCSGDTHCDTCDP